MSLKPRIAAGMLLASFLTFAQHASSAPLYVYVGSWRVDQQPFNWGQAPFPTAYTGQEAAALLFGGAEGEYAISTLGTDTALVNRSAWYTAWGGNGAYAVYPGLLDPIQTIDGYPAGMVFADTYKTGDYYAPGSSSAPTGISALGSDWAIGPQFTNYAFRIVSVDVPEPGSLALLGVGLAGLGLILGKRRRV